MKKYKNKKWLYQKYIVEKLSTIQISKICECNFKTIYNWLKIHKIKIRTISEAKKGMLCGELSPVYRPMKERFWEKVDKNGPNGCWIWVASKDQKGYGSFDKKRSHVISWIIHHGKILNDLHVLHKCDNPSCVNPEHLFLGTNSDNIKDRNNKNRQAKGEKHGRSKLTKKQVLKIRKKYMTGKYTYEQLAKEYSVTNQAISDIINNKTWKQ